MKKIAFILGLVLSIFLFMPNVKAATEITFEKTCTYDQSIKFDDGVTIGYQLVLTYTIKNNQTLKFTTDVYYTRPDTGKNKDNAGIVIDKASKDYYLNREECPAYVYGVACAEEAITFEGANYRFRSGNYPLKFFDTAQNTNPFSDFVEGTNFWTRGKGYDCNLVEFSDPKKVTKEEIEEAILNAGGSLEGTVAANDVICPFCIETYQVWRFFGYLLFILKLVIPIGLIVMGAIDYGKAVVASDSDQLKKSSSMFVKRIIAGIIIFFIPTIIKIAFNLVEDYASVSQRFTDCTVCLFDPDGSECEYMDSKKQTCIDEYLYSQLGS